MSTKSRQLPGRTLKLEQLEPRLCLSANPIFADGVLSIEGSRLDDTIFVSKNSRGIVAVVDGDSGKRWEFTAVTRIVIDTHEGNDFLRVQDNSGDVKNIDVAAGGGNDSIWIDLGAPVLQKVREVTALVKVDLGDGHDNLNVNAAGLDQIDFDITAGGGNDNVLIGLLLPAVQKVRDAAAKVHVNLGDGNNRLDGNAVGFNDVDFGVTAGGGEDSVLIGMLLPAVQKVREAAAGAQVNVDLGDGNNRLNANTVGFNDVDFDISSGGGDDSVLIGMLLPAVQKVREAAAHSQVNADLGDGNDRLNANTVGLEDVGFDITAGDGEDSVLIGMLLPAVQKVRESSARLNVDLGGGNDRFNSNMIGFLDVDLDITAGAGDDSVLIGLLLPAVQKVRAASARVNIDLGPGTDWLERRIRGYDNVDINITDDAGGIDQG